MSDFRAKITAELDTSDIKSQIQGINETLPLKVNTTKLRSEIQNALKKEFDIKVKNTDSNKNAKSKLPNNASSVRLTNTQLAQVETARRKSQIRTSEFEKKSNARVQEAKLKDINKLETAQKASDMRIREAQQKQEIRDASWREKQRIAEEKRIQKEREKIRERTDPDLAHERVYGGTYKNAYDHSLANGRSVKSAEKAGLSAVQAQKMHEFGDALEDVTRAGTRYVALPIAAATVASVKAFMDYETAFTGVRKTVDGTEAELQAVSDGLEQMALRVPVASTELAHIAQLGGQLGIPTKELLKFTETVAALEVSTNLQGEEGASTLARFMNVVNEDYGNIDRVGSAIVDLGNHFATTESEIATMSQRLGATGSIIGMSTSDILGYAAALSATGVKAEAGGSAMSRVWQDISQAVSEGGEGLNAYARVSKKTAAEFAATWKGSPTEAFNDLLKGLKESPNMIKALDDIGVNNVRDIRALQNLANRYDIVEDALGRANTAFKENTALSNEANRAYSTTASKLQLAKESITQAGRSIGEAVAPTVIDFAGGVQKAATGFANLGDGSKKAIVSFSLLTAGTIAGANGLAKMVNTGATLKQGFGVLKTAIKPLATKLLPGLAGKAGLAGVGSSALAATGPILAVGAAIAAIGVAAYKAKKHSDNLKMGATLKEESEQIQKHADRISQLNDLRAEVKELELVIKNPESSKQEIKTAKQRLEEIAAILEKDYKLKVDADVPDSVSGGLTAASNRELSELIEEGNKFTDKLGKAAYPDARQKINGSKQRVKDLTELNNTAQQLIAQKELIENMPEGREKSIRQDAWRGKELDFYDEVESKGFTENKYQNLANFSSFLKDEEDKLSNYQKTLNNVNTESKAATENYAKAMAGYVALNDQMGIDTMTMSLEQLGGTLREIGADTDYTAAMFAKAKLGYWDLNKAIEDGNIDNVVDEYFSFKEAIGETTREAVFGAGFLKQGIENPAKASAESLGKVYESIQQIGKQKGLHIGAREIATQTALMAAGFQDIQDVFNADDTGVTKFISNLKAIGEQTGQFKDMDISSIEKALNKDWGTFLPEGKTIKIDVDTGEVYLADKNIQAVFDKFSEGKTAKLSVETEADTSVIDNYQEKVDSLDGKTYSVNFDGNNQPLSVVIDGVERKLQKIEGEEHKFTLVGESGEAIGTIDLVNDKIDLLPEEKTITIKTKQEGAGQSPEFNTEEYSQIIEKSQIKGEINFKLTDQGAQALKETGEVITNLKGNENIKFRVTTEGLELLDTTTHTLQLLRKDGTVDKDVNIQVAGSGRVLEAHGILEELDGKKYETYLGANGQLAYAEIGGVMYELTNYDESTNTATILAENGQAIAVLNMTTQKIERLPEEKQITITTDGSAISGLNKVSQLIDELKGWGDLKFKINADTGGIDILNSAGELISNLKSDPSIDISINADTGNLEIFDNLTNQTYTINYKTGEIEPVAPQEGAVNYKKTSQEKPNDETAGVGYQKTGQQAPDDQTAGVNYQKSGQENPTDASAKVNYGVGEVKKPNLTLTGVINWVSRGLGAVANAIGGIFIDGTAHVEGTAFSQGSAKKGKAFKSGHWGTKSSGVGLGGELGEELIVRDGRFFTIGSDSAEFFNYRKDDIIFNAEQTKQIFEKGKITHGKKRGKALADGTATGAAFASGTNEKLTNYLKHSERLYKVHQDEAKYINDLTWGLNNLAQNEEEKLDIQDTINKAYKDLSANIKKDIEHVIDMTQRQNPNANVEPYYRDIQAEAHREAERLRAEGYAESSDEIQEQQKIWWEAQESILDLYTKAHEKIIRDIEHDRDIALEHNPYHDTTSYYKQMQDEYHRQAELLRALDPEKYKEEIQKLQIAWWEAQDAIVEWKWENSNRWIEERNAYNDWELFDDSEIDAWERVVGYLKKDYPNDIDKIREAEQKLFDARKAEFNKSTNFGTTYLESQKTLLQSHFDVTNAIAEARHELNKELETSKTMYEYLDDETRKLLFNQEDYNELSSELNRIEKNSLKLQTEYEKKLKGATLDTIESITSEYQMQYETLMKSYEVAKADLEVAKKKQKLNNVLNERNVRMFINGSWQWVANTEDVANAKSELADAEYARQVEQAGLTQKKSIDELTSQQNELGIIVKKFESGVISLGGAIYLAEQAIGNIPKAMKSMLNNAKIKTSSSSRSSSSGVHYSLSEISSMSPADRSAAWFVADETSKHYLHEANKRDLSGNYDYNSTSGSWTKKEYATGTRYTAGGLALMGEDGDELYITSNGRLIPINQPTIGNISKGGVVFNAEQMKNLRTMWDMSNLNLRGGSFATKPQSQQTVQTYDNRVIINGMTVDNGSSDGQALISALRRYVGNH